MRIGIAADHGGFEIKEKLAQALVHDGHEVVDFGADTLRQDDDYPDFVIPLARAVAGDEVDRGVAVCGSGVGACVAANKIPGIRAALITDCFSAHQGVEDDEMNVICLGGRVVGFELARDLVRAFIGAQPQSEERFKRRLEKVAKLERPEGRKEEQPAHAPKVVKGVGTQEPWS